MKELHRPDELHRLLPQADFVIMTVPQTPQTRGMMAAREFRLMKKTAFLINIGRGGCVILDDLVEALRAGRSPGWPGRVSDRAIAARTSPVDHARRADHAPRRRGRAVLARAPHRATAGKLLSVQRRTAVTQCRR